MVSRFKRFSHQVYYKEKVSEGVLCMRHVDKTPFSSSSELLSEKQPRFSTATTAAFTCMVVVVVFVEQIEIVASSIDEISETTELSSSSLGYIETTSKIVYLKEKLSAVSSPPLLGRVKVRLLSHVTDLLPPRVLLSFHLCTIHSLLLNIQEI